MSGICGWLNKSGNLDAARFGDMLNELSAFDAYPTAHLDVDSYKVGVSNKDNARMLGGSEGITVALEGFPVILDLSTGVDEKVSAALVKDMFLKDGISFLEKLDGSFSLAIYDSKNREVYLSIDKLGINQLYYHYSGDGLVFSSSLRSAITVLDDLNVSNQAIYDYMYFHSIPGPDTVYEGVKRLVPGSFVKISGVGLQETRYWTIEFENEHGSIDFQQSKAEFKDGIASAVHRCASEREKVGCFLSGGTDSSTITGLLAKTEGKSPET